MKLISWNVNGLRACVRKGFMKFFNDVDADIFCVQEIKLQQGQIDLDLPQHYQYWNYAERKGYSGVAVFTKYKPNAVFYGLNGAETQSEGRIITLEYDDYFLVSAYTPNSQRDLGRLDVRLEWEDEFLKHVQKLDRQKPVIICGDLNVAHQPIDLKNDRNNRGNSGFTEAERGKMTRLLDAGFIDTLRYFHPDEEDIYTWWSYIKTVRERNIGWRIDYFIVSERLSGQLQNATTHPQVLGSDHCPIELDMN